MKKGLIIGLIAGAAAVAGAAVFLRKRHECDCCDDDFDDDELACDDCCGDCCECDDEEDEANEIPAEKADESVIVTDACACGATEEEALNNIEDKPESGSEDL